MCWHRTSARYGSRRSWKAERSGSWPNRGKRLKHAYQRGGRGPWIAARIGRGIFAGLLFALLFGLLVMWLWNWLVPPVFGLGTIHYAQAVGLIVLARILFGIRGLRPGIAARHWHDRWGWSGPCSGEAAPNGGIADWRFYDAWWEEEGREAFRKYIDTRKSERRES
jgi:hypothetical protein